MQHSKMSPFKHFSGGKENFGDYDDNRKGKRRNFRSELEVFGLSI